MPMKLRYTLLVFATLSALASEAAAQTSKVTYVLDDVQVDTGSAGGPTSQMTGTFEWTYDVGDFENGECFAYSRLDGFRERISRVLLCLRHFGP